MTYPYQYNNKSVRFNHNEDGTVAVVDILVSDLNYAVNEFADETITDRPRGRLVITMATSKIFTGDPKKGIKRDYMVRKTGREVCMPRLTDQYAYIKRVSIHEKGLVYIIEAENGDRVVMYAKHNVPNAHLESFYPA